MSMLTRKSTFRESRPPKKFAKYMALMRSILDSEASCFHEVANQQEWQDAMVEYTFVMENNVWDIVPRLEWKSVVSSRWIYKIKHVVYDIIEKFKARFVAIGFSQKDGVEYEESFSPIAKYASIRVVISITSIMRWRIHQMDVKTTFLDDIIEEELYIEKPHGFEVHGRYSHVCRIKNSFYRLKQAPRAWYSKIDG